VDSKPIPSEATEALKVITELFGGMLAAVYLYGSAAAGGLQRDSDVDILAVTTQSLSDATRRELTARLMQISGRVGNSGGVRPLEVTVINQSDVVPWRYPPKQEYMYGEWLRAEIEQGKFPAPGYNPDLAILLAQVRQNSVSLFGPAAAEVLAPVPTEDIRKAMRESLPGLLDWLTGDERNVILTLARMLLTAATGEISSKDRAADWAISRLPADIAGVMELARDAYLGRRADSWKGREAETAALAAYMKKEIEAYLEG
jgi:aminoglycoside 9-adenylyltransferase